MSAVHELEADDAPHEPWPQGISRRATMRISDVLAALRIEFPTVTTSKLRFLEEQGLVDPVRTPSGYRQYSPADVERLRYVLTQQRDRYMPLKVIGERLAALDAGLDTETPARARLATSDGVAPSADRLTAERLAHEAGVDVSLVEDLVAQGVLRPGPRGVFDPWAREVVTVAASLADHGIDARHLRTFRAAAERQVDLVEQVVAPWRGQRSVSSRARAGTLAAEVGELCARMHTALVRSAVHDLAP
ncbi:transcriptional regulator, MerR family [Cellulomonas flavigena DSM 20109]|uniref:Transcriptional regulator, MerR family n=1 Tax=Cellulomonas flavigena (strain ATCC 482 / DSM 20109 / BCRC 11376 / JCM 18109 / NBRC 3775 / NCIMB 8073 / NRS 134) TaxID=446466 RepID=D5UEX2_CELFN|nr:MerR family transcriptional regulator [Cellulomonas flavigena]ADG74782.1 transcriptional regulator, MerR family [Cellulomonas flavigena DSM 20109]